MKQDGGGAGRRMPRYDYWWWPTAWEHNSSQVGPLHPEPVRQPWEASQEKGTFVLFLHDKGMSRPVVFLPLHRIFSWCRGKDLCVRLLHGGQELVARVASGPTSFPPFPSLRTPSRPI